MSTIKHAIRAFAVLALFTAGSVQAAEAWHQDYVKWVYPLNSGNFILVFASSPASCPSASSPKYFHVNVGAYGVTSDGARNMLATALMAFAAGKRISVAFESTSTSCDVNRLFVSD